MIRKIFNYRTEPVHVCLRGNFSCLCYSYSVTLRELIAAINFWTTVFDYIVFNNSIMLYTLIAAFLQCLCTSFGQKRLVLSFDVAFVSYSLWSLKQKFLFLCLKWLQRFLFDIHSVVVFTVKRALPLLRFSWLKYGSTIKSHL